MFPTVVGRVLNIGGRTEGGGGEEKNEEILVYCL